VYNNGTIFTVGNATHNNAIQSDNYPRHVFQYTGIDSITITNFKNFVDNSGFLNLHASTPSNLAGLTCDTYYNVGSYFQSAKTYCRQSYSNIEIAQNIYRRIDSILKENSYRGVEYQPSRYYVRTKNTIAKDKYYVKTEKELFEELDPNRETMKPDHSTNAYVTSAKKNYLSFWKAVNNHNIYCNTSYICFQFIATVDGLSLQTYIPPSSSGYMTSTSSSYFLNFL